MGGIHDEPTRDLSPGADRRALNTARLPQLPNELVLGGYRIVGFLGSGGMGSVYRARSVEGEREVALKLLHRDATPLAQLRFEREGETTAALDHPGIVRIHAAGKHEGQHWLAYELVEGSTLDEVLPHRPRREQVELIRDVARAIGHAHAHGVIHRDVKGGNIIVGADGRVRVTDFGLAHVAAADRLTQTHALLGTPSVMAPEQAVGGEVGPPADVWAVGVLLYKALTGAHPMGEASSLPQLVQRLRSPDIPSARSLDPGIPSALDRIVRRALLPAASDRYPNGDALADALDQWLSGAHPRRWGLPVALACGLLGAGGVVYVATRPPAADRVPAEVASEATPTPSRTPSAPQESKSKAVRQQSLLDDIKPARVREQDLRVVRTLASEGIPSAMGQLGRRYMSGKGLKRDPREGIRWLQRAAAKRHTGSMVYLAKLYRDGAEGVPKDPVAAVRWFEAAVDLGEPRAMYRLALLYQRGVGVNYDPKRALSLLRQAATLGHTMGRFHYACVLADGDLGAREDPARAATLLRELASEGYTPAMARLAMMLRDGIGVPRDPAKARWWLEKKRRTEAARDQPKRAHYEASEKYKLLVSLAEDGIPAAMGQLGMRYLHGRGLRRNLELGIRWLTRAAKAGEVGSMVRLARAYLEGRLVPKDLPTAAGWLRKAADRGDDNAMYLLSRLHRDGDGVRRDPALALSLLRRSADKGHTLARFAYAKALATGSLGEQDKAEGARLLRQLAEQGHPPAMEWLARMLRAGDGVPRDPAAAENWLRKKRRLDNRRR